VSVEIPSGSLLGVFKPQAVVESHDESALLREALACPVGTPRLRELAHAGQKVVIVTSDLTRPCPSEKLLPPVLAELAAAGVPEGDITVVVALGLHRHMSNAELEQTVGADVSRRVCVINHDPSDVVRIGKTRAGTPAEFFRPVVEADLRVCLGNVEFHYFVGYSGGAKAVLPGCASELTVNTNHAMMVRPEAVAGTTDGNPVRADLEEAVAMLGVDFILNVLVDGEHRIIGAVAGDVIAAHRKACEMVAERGKVAIPALADVVLTSAGGYPKDVNLYQAQKALDNAACAMRPGGIIILVGECLEGLGNRTFQEWMTQGHTPQELLTRIQSKFVLGGHKAAAIAKVALKGRIFLVSPALAGLSLTGLEHQANVQSALDAAMQISGPTARVIVLPEGGSVLPQAADQDAQHCHICGAIGQD
jgi:nickel-dependent lactate racemase